MTKLSDLVGTDPAATLDGTELLHVVQDGGSVAATMEQVAEYAEALAEAGTVLEKRSRRGAASGYAPLNSSSKVPKANLPGYTDVFSYPDLASFPGRGTTGKIYIAEDTDYSYIWDSDSSTYVLQGTSSSATLTLKDLPTAGVKQPCRLICVANVDIAAGGSITRDGVTTATGDRVLLAGQTAPAENGIYDANDSGSWTRSSDADKIAKLRGALVTVYRGTTYGATAWQTTLKSGTLGSTAIPWVRMLRTDDGLDGGVLASTVTATTQAAGDADASVATTAFVDATLYATDNVQSGTTYTLALADYRKEISLTHATGCALTIPTNASVALPVGTRIAVWNDSAGTHTIVGASGVTLNGISGGSRTGTMTVNTSGVRGGVLLRKIATDEWTVTGAIGAVA